MVIKTIAICIEEEDWNKLPYGKRSETVRKMIHEYINAGEETVEDVDNEKLGIEINKIENQIIKARAQKEKYETQIKRNMEAMEEKKKEELEKKKKELNKTNQCMKCGQTLHKDLVSKEFARGKACNRCYMSADANTIKHWMTGKNDL